VDAVFLVLGGIAGFAVGLGGGLLVGVSLREVHQAVYWVVNAIVVALGIAGNVYGLTNDWMWLVVGSLAFMGGAITGLKYGYAAVVGQWRHADDEGEGASGR
jgi:hypothetical protein